jgi:hypothetical protein
MAHFYGTIKGQRGEASRLGSKSSGLEVSACSWQGAVAVRLYAEDGVDMAEVSLAKHQGAGIDRVLYRGPVFPHALYPVDESRNFDAPLPSLRGR